MRILCLILMLLCSLSMKAQKTYQLEYVAGGYEQYIKHPRTDFKDSMALTKYLKELQLDAISNGFLLASIDALTFENRIAVVDFVPGPEFESALINLKPEDLRFLKNNSSVNERLVANLEFTPRALSSTMKTIQDAFLNNGYPFVALQLVDVSFENNRLDATLKIDRGPQYSWSKIHVRGDSSIGLSYVQSLIDIHVGDFYNEDLLLSISDQVIQVSFIEEIKPHEILFAKNGAELFVYLKSTPISSVNGVILRKGELLDLRWQSIRDQTQSLKSHLNFPFLFKTAFGIDGNFNLYKRDTSFLELQSTIGVQYFMNHGSFLKAFYQNMSSTVLSGGLNNPSFNKLGSTKSNNYGLSYVRRRVDYLPNPTKGSIMSFTGSAGTRKSTLSDTSQTITSLVLRGQFRIEYFIPLAKRHVIRIANYTEFYSADEIFENELYRFGGLTSQRGFNEDELFATTLSTSTIEYRYLLDKNSHVFAFYDQTWYENNTTVYLNDQPFGFGLGFAFSTNLGVFSISYALGKQLGNTILLSNSKVHFGYIAYF
jgi:outer membrane protein assembly factor BamA